MLRRLFPSRETYLLFAHAPERAAPTAGSDVIVHSLCVPEDGLTGALDEFCVTHGFGAGWPLEMLRGGARAFVACDPSSGEVMAMAWLTAREFLVAEIDHTFDPVGGVYLFGDFVAPAHRGKGLQRELTRRRLASVPGAAAYTIIRDDNAASIRNYRAVGLEPVARLTRRRWLGRSWWVCSAIADAAERGRGFERRAGHRLVPVGAPAGP